MARAPWFLTANVRRSKRSSAPSHISNSMAPPPNTILARFRALFRGRRFPSAAQLATVTDEALRACGFSWAKIAALRDIAAKTLDGTVPGSRAIRHLSDDEIIARLTQVRGVGRWTVEMLLIFKLGRPDVLPADDFGVRNGCRMAFGLADTSERERAARLRRSVAAARHHRRLVSLARRGRDEEAALGVC